MRVLTIIIYTLILIVFGLIGFAIMQIRLAGMTVKDFWSLGPLMSIPWPGL